MKLIYVSSYTFPSSRAEQYYLKSMAEAFVKILGTDFLFLIRGAVPEDLRNTNARSVSIPSRHRTLWYFLWFPFFVLRHGLTSRKTTFMSNDPYLLCVFIVWRKMMPFRYAICSDWHQLFDDWRDTFVSKNSNYLIVTTKRLAHALTTTCSVNPSNILVAYGGVNPELFSEKLEGDVMSQREVLGLPVHAFLVGYVGGFRSAGLEKGIDTMIKALPYVSKNIVMVFVGGTKQYIDEYIRLAEDVQVVDRCIFVEKQHFEKVIAYECAMDTLVIPYPDKHHFREYGFPLKVWEYMASGKPIIYSNLEIIAEVLEKRGVSCMPDDPVSLGDAITQVYEHPERFDRLAKQNTQDIKAFTWDTKVKAICNFIKIVS